MASGQRKPEVQWTPDERKAANLDQRLKSLIMFVLPDDQMNSVINCLTAKSTWDDLILYHEGPSDVKESRATDLKLCKNTFKFKEEFELASLFGKLKYEENLIESIYGTNKEKTLVSATPLSTAFFFTSIDEEEVSSDENEGIKVKALMELAGEERVSVGKESARDAKIDLLTMQHVNTEILKGNQNLRNELKELTSITESWLNGSNKVNQCISEQIPTQKKKILRINQLTEDSSSSEPKDLVVVKSSADNSNMSITSGNRPRLSEAEDFILPNHDADKPRLKTPTDKSSVCSTILPPLENLASANPVSGPKTIKSILKSNSTFKTKTLKGVIINEPSSAPAKGNISTSVSKTNSALAALFHALARPQVLPLQWTPDERKAANLDQRLKSLIMFVLPDDQMNSVINCLTAKSTWDDLILYHEGPSDVKESRVTDLKLCKNTFKFKEGETLTQTFTRFKALMNELVNDGIKLSKLEINIGFINGLPKKWLAFCQSLKNINHVKESELASLFGKLKYEENLIESIYRTNKEKTLISATPLSTAFFFTSIDEEEVSSDENEGIEVKALMALAGEERVSIGKESASNDYLCIDLNHVEEQRNNLLSKHRNLVQEPNTCKEQLLVLKQAKLDLLTMQHVNTEILKENQNLRNELKELTSITESWLNGSNKVNQCISEQIPTQKKKILGIDQLTEDSSSSKPKDLVFVKSSADNSNMSITSGNRPRLSEAEDFILPNHDADKVLPDESQRNTTDPSVVVTNSSASDYDSTDKSSVCSTILPPLENLAGANPVSGPNTIKSILKSNSTFKTKTLKGVIINEPSSAPAKGNISTSVSKTNSALAGKLKNVKIEYDPPLAIVMKELNELKLQISKNKSSYSINKNSQQDYSLRRRIKPKNPQHVTKSCETCGSNVHTTTDHNDIEWFRKREVLQAKKAENFKTSKTESSSALRSKTPTKRYLKGTLSLGLWYSKCSGFNLKGYSDFDYAGCNMDRKSTSCACQLLGGKLVCWSAKKQQSVAMSSAKAEYVAAVGCCANILWMKSQLTDFDIIYEMISIFCDNTNAIAISNNPVLHLRTKHIDIRYHFIRDHILKGDIELHFIPTQYQLDDIFTKPLDEPTFKRMIVELGMLNIDSKPEPSVLTKENRRFSDFIQN
ncbi:hypothetical protein Tco_0585030 [Tanacetum coccineum]